LRMRAAGLAVRGPTPMERLRPDGRLLQWRLLVPDGGSWGTPLPFFIQWDLRDADRLSWEKPGRHENTAQRIQSIDLVVQDLPQWVDVYQRQLGLEFLGGDRVAELGAARARFRCGETDLHLLAPDGPGPVATAIQAGARGPWQMTIAVSNIDRAARLLAEHGLDTLPAPGSPGGLLIPPELALNARIVLVGG
jgi:glyoxalase-like protein